MSNLAARLKKLEPPKLPADYGLSREEIDLRIDEALDHGDEWLTLYGKTLPPWCWAAVESREVCK